uniref:Uncharacterized protein n=1 Tax=viral metagenome TaxID=1070528 RepID=A0A6C0I0C6_9ZZZZ
MEFIVNKYDFNKGCWNTYLTNTFKYILCNNPKYAKYLSTMEDNNLLFSFLIYSRLDKDKYSEMFKELLISDIYELNRIRDCNIENSVIPFGYNNIVYIDAILLIMEIIKKYKNCHIDKYLHILTHLQILQDILPPFIYDRISSSDTDFEIHMHFILAFCYLNVYGNNEPIADFCNSIYNSMHISRAIQLAIGYAPNIAHLKKYNI